MKNEMLMGGEFGSVCAALIALLAGDKIGAIASIAIAAYMRYARVVK